MDLRLITDRCLAWAKVREGQLTSQGSASASRQMPGARFAAGPGKSCPFSRNLNNPHKTETQKPANGSDIPGIGSLDFGV